MRRWKLAVIDYDAALELDPNCTAALQGREEALIPYVPLPMLGEEEAARIATGE